MVSLLVCHPNHGQQRRVEFSVFPALNYVKDPHRLFKKITWEALSMVPFVNTDA